MPQPLAPLNQARLVLASASPRRAMLLEQIGVGFEVAPSSVEEVVAEDMTPGEVVESLSHQKATDVAMGRPEVDLVLGADTVVVSEGRILGKPVDAEDATRMLQALSGRWHQVFTGFTLVSPKTGRTVSGFTVSDVRFRELTEAEIAAYVATGEPLDKAGAYGIQERGALLVAEIRGDYSHIVGLPLPAVAAAWRELGWSAL
ncbi:MAG: Maf family protein [Candidatus Sericytochromatia bacterium]